MFQFFKSDIQEARNQAMDYIRTHNPGFTVPNATLRAKENSRYIFAVFYQTPNDFVIPGRYKLVSVARNRNHIEVLRLSRVSILDKRSEIKEVSKQGVGSNCLQLRCATVFFKPLRFLLNFGHLYKEVILDTLVNIRIPDSDTFFCKCFCFPLFIVLHVSLLKIFTWQKRRARKLGIERAHCSAITFVQRFGPLLNFHCHTDRQSDHENNHS